MSPLSYWPTSLVSGICELLFVIALFPVYLSMGVLRLRIAKYHSKKSEEFPIAVSWE